MSTSLGSTTLSNINSRQINSDEAIRNRQTSSTVLVDESTGEMLVDENGNAIIPTDQGDT